MNKMMTVVRPGLYGTRRLKAGDEFEANARDAKVYAALGWMTEGAPKRHQLDHDGNGKAGGSKKGTTRKRRKK